jgi:hypothetical protein
MLTVGQKIKVQQDASTVYGNQNNPITIWVVSSVDTESSWVPYVTFKGSKVKYAYSTDFHTKQPILLNGKRRFLIIEIL